MIVRAPPLSRPKSEEMLFVLRRSPLATNVAIVVPSVCSHHSIPNPPNPHLKLSNSFSYYELGARIRRCRIFQTNQKSISTMQEDELVNDSSMRAREREDTISTLGVTSSK